MSSNASSVEDRKLALSKIESKHNATRRPNISMLSGIRCLCCFWTILFHSHAFSAVFPLSSPCMLYIREFPILGFLSTSSLAVDVFWILSGLLCEYQLYFSIDRSKSLWPVWFCLNRLCRLYPLYLCGLLVTIASGFNPKCTRISQIIKSIFFMELPLPNNEDPCSGSGWSTNTDVHGYIVIILVCVLLHYNCQFDEQSYAKYKKYIMWCLYMISCIISLSAVYEYDMSWPVSFYCLEWWADPKSVEAHPELPNPLVFYPQIDIMAPELVAYRQRTTHWYFQLYFSSVFKHGAAMFVGSVLAINLIERNSRAKSNINFNINVGLQCLKLVIAAVLLYFVVDLRMDIQHRSPFWTFAYDKFFVFAVYFALDAMIAMQQQWAAADTSMFNKVVDIILGNGVWRWLARYTYGIYLFHAIPLISIIFANYPSDVENGGIGETDYGYLYLAKVFAPSLAISFVVAFVLYWMLEYPVMLIRYKYIRPKYSKQQPKAKMT